MLTWALTWALQGEDWEFEEDRQDDDVDMLTEHVEEGEAEGSPAPDRGRRALNSPHQQGCRRRRPHFGLIGAERSSLQD